MGASEARDEPIVASVLEELEAFLREARGPRALLALGPDASLERDLGLGSLERVELVSRLESRFRKKAPERTLGDAETARDLAQAFLEAAEDLDRAGRPVSTGSPRGRLAPPAGAATLIEVLRERARAEPDLPHVYLQQDESEEEAITYLELYREALLVGGALEARGLGGGETVAILLATSREFFSTFLGVLLAGCIPVPLYPPASRRRLEDYARRQSSILNDAQARLLVTAAEARPLGAVLRSKAPSLREVVSAFDLLAEARGLDPAGRALSSQDPALIQYTSGSTGDPKGVLLTHENLLTNIREIGGTLRIGPSDVGVSWLPLYHDMGLIGAWLTPLYYGIPVAILSPLAFLTRPERWLRTIHRKRGTISPAPNFAYELCARKIPESEIEGLDLGSWRAALNGAEPVSPETLERFFARFARCGFRRTSFLPVYGLAEASLLLSAPSLGSEVRVEEVEREPFEREGLARPPRTPGASPLRFVSMGRPIPGHEVRVVGERGEELPERREGRLLFRGPSVMKGYFRNSAATEGVLRPGGFVDSGDRGFFAEGELFVTGRAKDVIIKAGRNLVPQEIEAAASGVEGVRGGSVVAFGVVDPWLGTERLVVLAEAKNESPETWSRIESDVERAVVDVVGLPPDEVHALPPRTLPKTSSGKIRRSACRERWLRGDLGKKSETSFTIGALVAFHAGAASLRGFFSRGARLAYGAYVFLLSAAFVLPGWLLVLLGIPRRALARIVHRGSRLYLALAGVPLEVRGRQHLEGRRGPFVFVANHASYLDPVPFMAALDLDYAFAVKKEAAEWPILGRILRRLGHVFVEREKVEESASATRTLAATLAKGRSVVLFPEGTFARATGLRPFKHGAFQLAAETGALVVPVALVGTRRLLRDGTWIPRRVPVAVELQEPLAVERSFSSAVLAKERAAEILSRAVGEPRLE